MAIVYSYPTAPPESQDLLIGVEMAVQGGEGTPRTKTFTIGSIVELANGGVVGPEGPQGPAGAQGIQGITGTAGAIGPAGLNWQGEWVSGNSYVADDAVGWQGASWFCILATSVTTTPDVDITHWALLASQGAQGVQGVQGPTGPQGASGSASAQTNGIMYLTPSDSPYQTLSYDINRINLSSGSSAVRLPAAAPIGKEISVFLEDSTNSVNMFGDDVLNLSFPFLMGSANQQTGTFIIFGGESYVFISLGSGLWKVNAISKTIMTGSAASSSTTRTFINATNVSVLDRTTSSGNTLFKDALRFIRDNGSGVNRRIDLKCPTNITSDKTITFPDATGTVALETYKETVILLSYDGTDFTYTNVINQLNVTITFSVFSGNLDCTLSSSVLTVDKTIIWASSFVEFGGYLTQASRNNGTSFTLALTNTNGTNNTFPTSFYNLPIRIQVYN